jgi:hypothetical protein
VVAALWLLKKIEKNADENFSAAAWMLERRFPDTFSRPEIQLGVAMQINSTANHVLTITAEQAENLSKRNSVINKQLDEVAKEYESRRGSGDGATEMIREVESSSSLVENTDAITLPPAAGRTPGWWKTLSSGDGSRAITEAAAEFVLKDIASEVLGSARGSGVRGEWDSDVPALSDLWEALESACGPAGWAALVARGSRPQDD